MMPFRLVMNYSLQLSMLANLAFFLFVHLWTVFRLITGSLCYGKKVWCSVFWEGVVYVFRRGLKSDLKIWMLKIHSEWGIERLLSIHSLYFVYFHVYANRDWKGRFAPMFSRAIAAAWAEMEEEGEEELWLSSLNRPFQFFRSWGRQLGS